MSPDDEETGPPGEATMQLYLDIGEQMRHYGNMRFAHLSLYFAVLGALLGVVAIGEPDRALCVVFALAGAGASGLFWVMDERSSAFFYHYRDKAIEIETAHNFGVHRGRPDQPWLGLVRSANATRALFGGGLLLSIAVLVDCLGRLS